MVFVVEQAAQLYNIYLIICVCVVTTNADARGHTYNPLKLFPDMQVVERATDYIDMIRNE